MSSAKNSTQLVNAAKIGGAVIACVGLFFGGNLYSRCEGLQTKASAASQIEAVEAKVLAVKTGSDARMDRIEKALEKTASQAEKLEVLRALERNRRRGARSTGRGQ
jgi:hypothetical protein